MDAHEKRDLEILIGEAREWLIRNNVATAEVVNAYGDLRVMKYIEVSYAGGWEMFEHERSHLL